MVDYFWSRIPGKFLDKMTGRVCTGASFTGNVHEWYETLVEVMADVQRSALKENGGAPITGVNWIGDPDVMMIAATSVLVREDLENQSHGVLGAPMHLILCYGGRIPMVSEPQLIGTGKLILMNGDGRLGTVTVTDLKA